MNDIYSYVYRAFILSSVVAFIIGFFSNSKVEVGSYIAGYTVLSFGIIMLLLILLSNLKEISQTQTTTQQIMSGVIATGPFVLMLCVIAFVLYMLITYKDKIIEQRVAPGYNSFTNIIIFLLLIQTYLVYSNVNTDKFHKTHKLPGIISGLMYLLSTIICISSIILYIILKYYSTDGFQNLT